MVILGIENFQSHSRASLKIEGFTTIVGQSNSGKSAIIRSLLCVFRNTFNKSWVSHSKSSLKVGLKYEGICYEIERDAKGKINFYKITLPSKEVIVVEKAGRGTHDIVSKKKLNNMLMFQTQFEPLFILGGDTTKANELFNSAFGIDRLETINSLVLKDLAQAKKSVKDLASALEAKETYFKSVVTTYNELLLYKNVIVELNNNIEILKAVSHIRSSLKKVTLYEGVFKRNLNYLKMLQSKHEVIKLLLDYKLCCVLLDTLYKQYKRVKTLDKQYRTMLVVEKQKVNKNTLYMFLKAEELLTKFRVMQHVSNVVVNNMSIEGLKLLLKNLEVYLEHFKVLNCLGYSFKVVYDIQAKKTLLSGCNNKLEGKECPLCHQII